MIYPAQHSMIQSGTLLDQTNFLITESPTKMISNNLRFIGTDKSGSLTKTILSQMTDQYFQYMVFRAPTSTTYTMSLLF